VGPPFGRSVHPPPPLTHPHTHTHFHSTIAQFYRQAMEPSGPCVPIPMHAAGVTTPLASFLCAMTQFFCSADLCQLDRVCRTDHLALESLWNTCATKCKGQLPVQELRSGNSNPRDRAYHWSVTWRAVHQWVQTLTNASGSNREVLQSFMTHPHPCKRCHPRHTFGNSYGNAREYSLVFPQSGAIHHNIGPGHRMPYPCEYLKQEAVCLGFDTQLATATPTLSFIRALVHLPVDNLHYTFIHPQEINATFVHLWFRLGVFARLPLWGYWVPDDERRSLSETYHNAIDWIGLPVP
jgi:hypothetical protein